MQASMIRPYYITQDGKLIVELIVDCVLFADICLIWSCLPAVEEHPQHWEK